MASVSTSSLISDWEVLVASVTVVVASSSLVVVVASGVVALVLATVSLDSAVAASEVSGDSLASFSSLAAVS